MSARRMLEPTSPSTLFPLPCSAFEKYMLFDDRPSHPMVSFLELAFRGRVEIPLFEQAARLALQRHPLLAARISGSSSRQLHWNVDSDEPEVDINVVDAPHQLPRIGEEHLDLRVRSGLRVWIIPELQQTRLYLQVHHAAADALGMLTFMTEWLAIYRDFYEGNQRPVSLPPPSCQHLPSREDLSGLRSPYPSLQRWRRIGRSLFGPRPAPLNLQREAVRDDTSQLQLPGHCQVSLSSHELTELKRRARAVGATVGDFLLLAAFSAVAKWNPPSPREDESFRIVVPVSRRSPEEMLLSATNKISYVLLTRRRSQLSERSRSLKSIAADMDFVRRNRLRIFNLLKTLRLLDRAGLLERVVRNYPCFATLVVSNVGDLSKLFNTLLPEVDGEIHAGNLVLESIRCAPPRRTFTHTTLVGFGYAGELHLVSRGDGRGLSAAQTQSFLESVRSELLDFARHVPPDSAVRKQRSDSEVGALQ